MKFLKSTLFIILLTIFGINGAFAQVSQPDSDEREPEYIINDIDRTLINLEYEKRYITSYLPTQDDECNLAQNIEEEFLCAVVAGDIESVIDFIDVNFMDGRGIDFTSNSELGEEALEEAVANSNIDMIGVLLDRGARWSDENEEGRLRFLSLIASNIESFLEDRNKAFDQLLWNITRNYKRATNPQKGGLRNQDSSYRAGCWGTDPALLQQMLRLERDAEEEAGGEDLNSVKESIPCSELIESF